MRKPFFNRWCWLVNDILVKKYYKTNSNEALEIQTRLHKENSSEIVKCSEIFFHYKNEKPNEQGQAIFRLKTLNLKNLK
jgi:hypothetical protein